VLMIFKASASERVQRARIVDDDKELDSVGTIIKSLDDLMLEDELSSFDKLIAPVAADAAGRRRPSAALVQEAAAATDNERNNLKLKIMYRVASKLNSVP